MPNSTRLKTLTLSDGTYNNTLPIEDTTARNDIATLAQNLAPVATSGDYNDLSNKPAIPAAQVQSNWNETNPSSKAYIQNKPATIGLVEASFTETNNVWSCDMPIEDIIAQLENNIRVIARLPEYGTSILEAHAYYRGNDSKSVIFVLVYGIYSYAMKGTAEYDIGLGDWGDDTWIFTEISLVDTSTYSSGMSGKQDTLVSGTNIKTINNQSLLGSGNINIQGSGGGGGDTNVIEVVKVNGSALTPDANKAVNINNIPWSIVSSKPTIPDVSGKADKVSGGVTGHIAELDANGNLADGGVAASDVEDAVTNKHTHSNKTLLDKIPSSLGSAGQALCVNNAANGLEFKNISGGGGLTDYDFAHEESQGVSGTVTVTYAANQRGTRMVGATADIAIAFVCNNAADNYLWVKNNHGSNDIDVTISSVQYGGSQMTGSKIFVPDDSITIAPGYIAEIGIICNDDGAFITARCDLKANS